MDERPRVRLTATAGPRTRSAFRAAPGTLGNRQQPCEAHFSMDRHPRPIVCENSLTVNGPYARWGQATRQPAADLRVPPGVLRKRTPAPDWRILAALLRRAFRRW
ncbi:MAG: hypothetical protein IPM24_28510 [Bryobacterales bacterium]|nr:hypothetical protein [Bryobacterales bacterium]